MGRFGWNWLVAVAALVLMMGFPSAIGFWIALALVLELIVSTKGLVSAWRSWRENLKPRTITETAGKPGEG